MTIIFQVKTVRKWFLKSCQTKAGWCKIDYFKICLLVIYVFVYGLFWQINAAVTYVALPIKPFTPACRHPHQVALRPWVSSCQAGAATTIEFPIALILLAITTTRLKKHSMAHIYASSACVHVGVAACWIGEGKWSQPLWVLTDGAASAACSCSGAFCCCCRCVTSSDAFVA